MTTNLKLAQTEPITITAVISPETKRILDRATDAGMNLGQVLDLAVGYWDTQFQGARNHRDGGMVEDDGER